MKTSVAIIAIIMILCSLSCDGKKNENMKISFKEAPYNISQEGDGLKFNYDSLSVELIEFGKKNLKDMNFKFPSNEDYSNKLINVFDWDIDRYSNEIIALNSSKFPYIAIKSNKYVLFENSEVDNEFLIDIMDLYHFNNYIFYNNRNSFNILKTKNKNLLEDLVLIFGYNKDKDLVKYVFKSFDFNNFISFHDLIFSYNPENGKYILRKSIIDDIQNYVYNGVVEDFSYAKEGNGYNSVYQIIEKIETENNKYENPNEIIAYLYDKELQVGIFGYIQQKLDYSPEYADFLKKNKFFNYQKLKDYVEIIYQSPESLENENLKYFIQDQDGFTNLRKEKNSQSEVLQKIKSGEHIDLLDNTGDWWQIKTKEGNVGYVHKSRIKSGNSNNNSASLLLYDRPDFNSFSREVLAKGELEIKHETSGWQFVKINDKTGYIPTKEQLQKFAEAQKQKHSFLAEDKPLPKKKGFWDKWFG